MTLPSDSNARKQIPLATGLLDYFPDALAKVAELSYVGNEKHNPGQPLHWNRPLSSDHADCLLRHLLARGRIDDDGIPHSAKVAWRALALLQLEEEQRQHDRYGLSQQTRSNQAGNSLADPGLPPKRVGDILANSLSPMQQQVTLNPYIGSPAGRNRIKGCGCFADLPCPDPHDRACGRER